MTKDDRSLARPKVRVDRGGDPASREDPERTCAGCRAHDGSDALLRFAHVPEGEPVLVPDLSHRLGGRGVWVHPRTACVRGATRGGFARALRGPVQLDLEPLLTAARAQLARRIAGLLTAARRRGWLAQGTDAVLAALGNGPHGPGAACPVRLLLVAKDAAGRRNELVTRASEWRVEVVELFDKAELGRLFGRQELSFVAVLEPRIAREVADSARWLAGLSEDG